jgi:hypothetical protein
MKRRTQSEQMSSGLLHKADFGGSLRDVAEGPILSKKYPQKNCEIKFETKESRLTII